MGQEFFKETVKFVTIAKRLQCKQVVLHPFTPFKDEFFKKSEKFDFNKIRSFCEDVNFEYFTKLKPYLKDLKIECAIENLYTTDEDFKEQLPSSCSDSDEWKKYIDVLGEDFCACFDTGHANITSHNDDELNRIALDMGHRIKALHVNDNFAKFNHYGDFHLLPMKGDIDFVKFVKTLKKIGYKGLFNYECVFNIWDKNSYLNELKYVVSTTEYIYNLANKGEEL